jgi:hypothetical protein
MDHILWLVRVALLAFGGALTAWGIGDAAMWEAVAGGLMAAVSAAWSWWARRAALATIPPEAAAKLKAVDLAQMARGLGR